MDYSKTVRYSLTDMSEHEASAVQAGLILLANGAKQDDGASYPEYKKTAAGLLGKMDVPQSSDK